jgi:F0F1-type ATP synthase alpha subunit
LPLSSVTVFGQLLQEYITAKDTRFFDAVKEAKKLTPESEALLKEAIIKIQENLESK